MTTVLILTLIFVLVLVLIWPRKTKKDYKPLYLEDLVQRVPTDKNIILQEQEDELYYQMIKKEADKQVHNVTVMGWIADPSMSNLMKPYNVYDKHTAKYLNANPIELCLKMIEEILEHTKMQRELVTNLSTNQAAYPLTPDECYLPLYKKSDLNAHLKTGQIEQQ